MWSIYYEGYERPQEIIKHYWEELKETEINEGICHICGLESDFPELMTIMAL